MKRHLNALAISETNRKKNKSAWRYTGKLPNFDWLTYDPQLLEEGTRHHSISNPVESVSELYKELRISCRTDFFAIELAQQVYPRIRQRTPAWYESRKLKNVIAGPNHSKTTKYMTSGSAAGNLLGLHTAHAQEVFKGKATYGNNDGFRDAVKNAEPKFTRWTRVKMKCGERKERDAMIHMVQSSPDEVFYETGATLIPVHLLNEKGEPIIEDDPVMLVYISPDGKAVDKDGLVWALEIKCPGFFELKSDITDDVAYRAQDPYPHIPYYYAIQLVLEMMALGVKFLKFVSFTLTHGFRKWTLRFPVLLAQLIMEGLLWVREEYVVGGKEIPPSSVFPLKGWSKHEEFFRQIKIFLTSFVENPKDYKNLDNSYTLPETREMWLDDEETHADLRLVNPDKYCGVSMESIPEDIDESQGKLDSFFKPKIPDTVVKDNNKLDIVIDLTE